MEIAVKYFIGSEPHGVYTGYGWAADMSQLKWYGSREEAESVIKKHQMPAEVHEVSDDDAAGFQESHNADGSTAA